MTYISKEHLTLPFQSSLPSIPLCPNRWVVFWRLSCWIKRTTPTTRPSQTWMMTTPSQRYSISLPMWISVLSQLSLQEWRPHRDYYSQPEPRKCQLIELTTLASQSQERGCHFDERFELISLIRQLFYCGDIFHWLTFFIISL